jgi:hypothetical protein
MTFLARQQARDRTVQDFVEREFRDYLTCGVLAARENYSWSELLKRVFEIDILVCERCGGPVRVIAAIQEPETAQQILNHLGLPSRPPPITPARYERHFHPDDFAS